MKIVIAGSRQLPQGQAPRLLVRFLAGVPEDAVVLLRKGLHTRAGSFELDVAGLCGILSLDYEWRIPRPTDATPGRASVFVRDIDMVEEADLVLLFLASVDDGPGGTGGTNHLLDKAIDANRPVYAYLVAGSGDVMRLGDHDPDSLYAEMVPAA